MRQAAIVEIDAVTTLLRHEIRRTSGYEIADCGREARSSPSMIEREQLDCLPLGSGEAGQ